MGQPLAKLSLQDFLAWENQQSEKHEFVQGEVFAMVGARRVHNIVCLNLATALRRQLRGKPCQPFMESAKLQTNDDTLLYPDVFVTCDPQDLRTEQIFRAPTFIAEVLSPSTQAYDRGVKFTLYRQLASLREYLLVDPDTREVQLFRRGAEGLFTLHDLTGAAQVSFTSLGCGISAVELFEGLTPEGAADSPATEPPV